MKNGISVLLAEDDENLGALLSTFLRNKGYAVELAKTGKKALELFNESFFQFIVLDVMMPELDGFKVAEEIRIIDKEIPILFLTAKAMKEDKLMGFSLGADDYLTKPFSMEELIARIEAIYKRIPKKDGEESHVFNVGKFKFDSVKRTLEINDKLEKLTTKESQLLKLLVRNKNEVLDRQAALRAVWGDDNYFNGRSMDVYIAKLRKMLKADHAIEIINIHGKGFKLID